MKIAIIGGGIMGLTIAHSLSQKNIQVDLFEAAPQLGGLCTWFDYGPYIWDKYYHVILRSDKDLINFIKEVGLENTLVWKTTQTGFFWNKQFVSMSNYWEFLTFPVLNIFEKMRLAAGILYSHSIKDYSSLEGQTAPEWLKKVFGKGVYSSIWEPLLESKFGVLKDRVPASIICSTLNRYYSTRSKEDGKERMGHLHGVGYKTLIDLLQKKIEGCGSKIHTALPILSMVQDDEGKYTLKHAHGSSSYDYVINTMPSMQLKKIAPQLQGIYSNDQPPEFLGVIRHALLLKKPLTPYYVTNLIDRSFSFTGIIGVSALALPDEMQGGNLLMLPRYDVPNSPWFSKSDSEIESIFLNQLRNFWPNIDQEILGSFVHREKIIQALWIQAPPNTRHAAMTYDKRVWNINAELVGRDALNNNAIVRAAKLYANEFFDFIKQRENIYA